MGNDKELRWWFTGIWRSRINKRGTDLRRIQMRNVPAVRVWWIRLLRSWNCNTQGVFKVSLGSFRNHLVVEIHGLNGYLGRVFRKFIPIWRGDFAKIDVALSWRRNIAFIFNSFLLWPKQSMIRLLICTSDLWVFLEFYCGFNRHIMKTLSTWSNTLMAWFSEGYEYWLCFW